METIACADDLKCTIEKLEKQRKEEGQQIKEVFQDIKSNLSPANIVKNTIQEVKEIPNLKKDVVKAALGLTVGFLAKKVLIRSSLNPLRRIAGNALEVMIAGYITKHPQKFRSLAVGAMRLLMKLKQKKEQKLLAAPAGV
jgi:uncharacterized protein (UPF0335 family)